MRKGRNLHCTCGDLFTSSAHKNSTKMTKIIRFPPKMTETAEGFTLSAPNEHGVAAVATVSHRYGIQTVLRWRASSRSMSTCDTSTKLFTRSAIRFSVRLCANGKHQRSNSNQNEEKREQLHRFSTYHERHPSACSSSRSVAGHRRALETPPELQEALYQV